MTDKDHRLDGRASDDGSGRQLRRRAVLASAGGVITGLAGCASQGGGDPSPTASTPTAAPATGTPNATPTGTPEPASAWETVGSTDPDWRQFGPDLGNSFNNSSATGPHDDVAQQWRVRLTTESGDGKPVQNAGIAIVDGVAYISTGNFGAHDDGSLTAIDTADGAERWTYTATGHSRGIPGIGADTAYVTIGETLYALAIDDGSERWQQSIEGLQWDSSAVLADGTVYIVGSRLVAIDQSGEVQWRSEELPRENADSSTPTRLTGHGAPLIVEGAAYCPIYDGARIAVIGLSDGRLVETIDLSGAGLTSLGTTLAAGHGHLYVGNAAFEDGPPEAASAMAALDPESGAVEWAHPYDNGVVSVSLTAEAVIFAVNQGGLVAAAPDTGEILWEQPLDWLSSCTTDGETIYADVTGGLVAFDVATGEELWRAEDILSTVDGPPTVVGDSVYVGDTSGFIYRFSSP